MRVVHYAAHGSHGLAFQCYHDDRKAHLDSHYAVTPKLIPGRWSAPEDHYRIPAPKSHTDLRRVTCSACWSQIRKMAASNWRKQ